MSELVKELRAYPAHYTAAHKAADRIEALENALQKYSCDCNLDNQDNCEVWCWDSASCGYAARVALEEKNG